MAAGSATTLGTAGRPLSAHRQTNRTTFAVARYFFSEEGQLIKEIRNCTDTGTTPPGDPAGKTCAGGINATKNSATNLINEYEYDANGNRVAVTAANVILTIVSRAMSTYMCCNTKEWEWHTVVRQ